MSNQIETGTFVKQLWLLITEYLLRWDSSCDVLQTARVVVMCSGFSGPGCIQQQTQRQHTYWQHVNFQKLTLCHFGTFIDCVQKQRKRFLFVNSFLWTRCYQVNQKKSPLRLLLILQQCMGIFVQNFTRLLSDQIYTLSPSFIEIFLELTKLHSFNHDDPHFTRWKLCCLPR